MRRRRRQRLPWAPFLLVGFVLGGAIEWWRLRPPGPFVPTLVAGLPVTTATQNQHLIRTWTLAENADATAEELSHELGADGDWQPPTVRSLNPKTIQFVRVHSPNGDFQFTRLTVTDLGNGTSRLTIDDEPKQAHAFR
ncbi:MAG: hypothetical protein ACYC96_13760 [Fimbriimonadaceae bacterium]